MSSFLKGIFGSSRAKRKAERLEARQALLESQKNETETDSLIERAESVTGRLRAHEKRNHFAERIDNALYGRR